ncbi:hypothetical protein HCN51_45605 [Nonomuraea sp. FMUSA5-5]|uniref:Uncharacterized protein n=1 Tax=Nonomuraea composti TaxID=2720023 RepID=A0ABX1BI79_9ACTN|nr:hypothetical protein [Nonomuraea sp. FMUSA5-5]NJP96632.1 hypothetical protein [Nonomuraea sp. FMUSA5-5]
MALPSYDLDVFRAAFPTWSIFCSDAGVFYATRRGVRLRNEDIDRGLHQTVSADDLETFIAVLLEQCQLTVTL